MATAPADPMPVDSQPKSGVFVEHTDIVPTEREVAIGEAIGAASRQDTVQDGDVVEVIA